MSEILQEISRKLVFPIDYPSQKALSKRTTNLIKLVALVAFIYGCLTESIKNLLIAYASGIVVIGLIVVPPYPSYTRQKLVFVKPAVATVSI